MSVATQITRLQGVRDQIRTKMVGLGLSSNTDLLQDLADDLDGVNKVSPTNNGITDPGSSYTNVDTLSRSTSTRYIKVPKGYNDADRKFTVSGVANGSVSAATTTDPGADYANKATVTPTTKSDQFVTITAGYLPNSKITVNAIPAYGFTIDTDAWSDMFPDETGSYTCTIAGVTGVTADNDIVVDLGGSEVTSCGVYACAQGASSITFKAFDIPSTPVGCVVYILNN